MSVGSTVTMAPLKFPTHTLLLVLMLISLVYSLEDDGQRRNPNPEPTLAQSLGKEFVLLKVKDNLKTLRAWNYSECAIKLIRNLPYVVTLAEDNGEFHLTTKINLLTVKFHLNEPFRCSYRSRKGLCLVVLYNTTLVYYRPSQTVTIVDFTTERVLNLESSNSSFVFKPRQQTDGEQLPVPSSTAPLLAPVLGKEFVLEPSSHNKNLLKAQNKTCISILFTNIPQVIKLSENNGEFELTVNFEVDIVKFQIGKPTVDSRGLQTKVTLNGTTLTRVSDFHLGHFPVPRTSIWRFHPDELQLQEVVGTSNRSLIFKPRSKIS